MSSPSRGNTRQTRDSAKGILHRLTRAAILAAAAGASLIGIVVAREHPGSATGSAGAGSKTSPSSGSSTGGTSSGDTGGTGNTGDNGNAGSSNNFGNQGTSAPTPSPSRPNIVSGGTSR